MSVPERAQFLAIGECMIELTRTSRNDLRLAYAGDACNTAVYLSRLSGASASVRFLTATGDDELSDDLIAFLRSESISPVARRIAGTSPALYIVSTSPDGERSFTYYRDASPVRHLLNDDDTTDAFDNVQLVFFTAITLQMLMPRARDRLFALVAESRAAGALIAFDSNYRPSGWPDEHTARRVTLDALRITDISLPSLDDESRLFGTRTAAEVIERHRDLGVREIVVKDGPRSVTTWAHGLLREHPCSAVSAPVDTTGAGDSFDAGYLYARSSGASVDDSVRAAQSLAGLVVRHAGAIVEREEFHKQCVRNPWTADERAKADSRE